MLLNLQLELMKAFVLLFFEKWTKFGRTYISYLRMSLLSLACKQVHSLEEKIEEGITYKHKKLLSNDIRDLNFSEFSNVKYRSGKYSSDKAYLHRFPA